MSESGGGARTTTSPTFFENWNRYYEPFGGGRYLQPEPMLSLISSPMNVELMNAAWRVPMHFRIGGPSFVAAQAAQGMGAPAYSYALNNPLGFVDDNGLGPKKGGQYTFPPAGSPFANNPPAGWGGPTPRNRSGVGLRPRSPRATYGG